MKIETCEPKPKLADIGLIVTQRGGIMKVAREIGVNRNTLYRWIDENSLPKDRAVSVGALWGVPYWRLHDPWGDTAYKLDMGWTPPEPEAIVAPAPVKAAPKGKPPAPPMLRPNGQPQPGWRYVYRPTKVDQYNTVMTVRIARGAEWIESFPAEGIAGFPVRFTWLDGREIGLADNGSGTLVYVEVDTGHPFGDSKPAIRKAHAAIRAMATRGVHDRVEAKWEGDWDDIDGVDGED